MTETVDIWEKPQKNPMYMILGWRQWADAGSTSSGLPQYIIDQTHAHRIGTIHPGGFYLFQFPGTHDLVRPIVKFTQGYPDFLQSQRNDFYYAEVGNSGLIIFLGDEPHLDVERYVSTILDTAVNLGVKRIVGLGGVFGEVPYDKERNITCNYSLAHMKEEITKLSVSFSDYEGGASIGSIVCRRSADRGIEYIGLYAYAPLYDFSEIEHIETTIRIENDFTAWLGIMQRINYMLKLNLELSDLEEKSQNLIGLIDTKVDEFEKAAPQVGVRDYFQKLSDAFTETPFNPYEDVWEEKLRQILDKFESNDEDEKKE
jgi:predicted ATP-grasp superfamily ATP-dependent carboligase